jgi:predicted nuclease of predicted toxin-antitoxin system
MIILLDHCVPRRYLRLLISWGYPSELITAHIPADSPDEDVLALALSLDAALLTVDMDFANILDYPPEDHEGIIVIRNQAQKEQETDTTLKQALDDLYRNGLRSTLVIISPGRYRVRRPSEDV